MNTINDFDRRAAAWLADGPSELSDRVLDAALHEVHLTHQRRRWSAPWRFARMSNSIRAAAAVAVVAIVGVGVLAFNSLGPGAGRATPAPSRSSPAGTGLLDVSTWTAFTSTRYGFSVRYPPTFVAVPSQSFWRMPDAPATMFDGFHDDGAVKWLDGVSMLLPVGATRDDWYAEYRRDVVEDDDPWEPETCFTPPEDWSSTTVDGRAADLRVACEAMEAFVFVADRVYVFGAFGYDTTSPPTARQGVSDELRDLFELWLTTITLDPASAVDPTPVPTASST
jgi:hypothetical protein